MQDTSMERDISLEVIDSTNNDGDLEKTGKMEDHDEEFNVPLIVHVNEGSQSDNGEDNNHGTNEVNSGIS